MTQPDTSSQVWASTPAGKAAYAMLDRVYAADDQPAAAKEAQGRLMKMLARAAPNSPASRELGDVGLILARLADTSGDVHG